MAKKLKIILSVLLVVLIGAAAVVFTGVLDINKKLNKPEKPSDSPNAIGTDYKATYTANTAVSLPLMKTEFEDIFYTMSKQGEVHFYQASAGTLTEIPESGNFEVKAECSSQKLPAVIHYIEKDGKTDGYGLFTNIIYPDVLLYDYAFFKVTNMFGGFDDGKGTLLMMLDVDNTRFYKEDKVYSEIFYLYSDHTSKHFLSEDQRTVAMDGRVKTDYKMFTNNILAQGDSKNVLFFSSRYYVSYDETGLADIFTSGGSGTNVDNIRYIKNVASLNFWRNGSDTYYFEKNYEDNSFSLYRYDGEKATEVKKFGGDIKKDYLISGEFILTKSTGEVYNCISGQTLNIIYSCFNSGFTADLFTMSENGKYAVVRGVNGGNNPACGIMNFDANRMTAYEDNVFAYIANAHVLNDGSVYISAATGESASAFYQLTGKAQ